MEFIIFLLALGCTFFFALMGHYFMERKIYCKGSLMMALYLKFLHLAILNAAIYNMGTFVEVEIAEYVVDTLTSVFINSFLYLLILIGCLSVYLSYNKYIKKH